MTEQDACKGALKSMALTLLCFLVALGIGEYLRPTSAQTAQVITWGPWELNIHNYAWHTYSSVSINPKGLTCVVEASREGIDDPWHNDLWVKKGGGWPEFPDAPPNNDQATEKSCRAHAKQ
jgi:hypothetical protein